MKEKIEKLPKWAQEYIHSIQRERNEAVRKLQEYEDEQTPSGVYYEDLVSDGANGVGPTLRRKFIQAHRVTFEHLNVKLEVLLRQKDCPTGCGIELRWGGDKHLMKDACFLPTSYQAARIVSKEEMR